MKRTMKRMLLVMLALMMAVGVMAPAAMASEEQVVSNATSTYVYAGMKDTLVVYRNGVRQKASLYKWKSSNSSIVGVNSKGVITGKKGGSSATIYATRKSDGSRCSIRVSVKRNKVNNINSKPSATRVTYKSGGILLKSVEIVSPTKVVVEYYVAFNFPSSWKASEIKGVSDAINLHNRSTGSFEKTIVGDAYQTISTKIKGFAARYGKSVQVIKVTYSGSQVDCANIRLSDYRVSNSGNVRFTYKYYR